MQFQIETERLILRDLLNCDAEGMYQMDSNPLVHRYLGQKPISTIEEARQNINFIRKQYIDFGIGRWAVIEKSTGLFIGWAGLKWIVEEINNHSHFYDLGYRLLPEHWGKGFATEATRASIDYGLNTLNLHRLYAITHIENEVSKHVLEKTGFRLTHTFMHKDLHCNWLELTKED